MPRPRPTLTTTPERWRTLLQRLLDGMHEDGSGCWHWTRARQSRGYGSIGIGAGRTMLVHRLSYELLNGPIPEGMTLDHKCRTKGCCNPDHLEPVTAGENTLRGESPSARNARKTRCHRGHPLSGDNVIIRSTGQRRCRACRREYDAKRKALGVK